MSAARVMVVDDEGDLRLLLRAALTRRAEVVVVAEAGDGATALIEAERTEPDIVVLDLQLPDLRGADLLEELRRRRPQVRVVVFSGTADRADADEVLARGAAAFVEKSGIDRLVDVVEGFARERSAVATLVLPSEVASAAVARSFVRTFCISRGCLHIVDNAALVTSELVTNAVLHASSPCELRVSLDRRMLRLAVTDEMVTAPSPRGALPHDESGRGLQLVGALSQAWGIEAADHGKTVWAEISLEP